MIKINLLPKSITEKRVMRNLMVLFGVVLVMIIVGGTAFSMSTRSAAADMEQQAATAEANKARVEGIEQQAQKMLESVKPMQQKLDFINAVLSYNGEYPKLYEEVAKWTYEKVSYLLMSCDGSTLTIAAKAKSLDDVGRYLLNMYRATDLFSEVVISGVPGYGAQQTMGGMGGFGGEIGGSQASLAGIGAISSSIGNAPLDNSITFGVSCKLKTPITAPAFGAAAAAAPGAPGAAPAAPAAMPASPPM